MTYIFKLPDVGEGMHEGEIVKWFVKEGDVIKEDEPLLELQNDKLLQEIPAPVSGKVSKILVEPGTVVEVGTALIEITADNNGDKAIATTTPIQTETPASEPVKTTPQKLESADTTKTMVLAMPAVRQWAYQNGIDLANVTPNGHNGQITMADVQAYAANSTVKDVAVETTTIPATGVAPVESDIDYKEKLSAMRKAIAKNVSLSSQVVPHVTLFDEVVVDKLVAHRNKYKESASTKGIKLTYLAYFVKALTLALKEYPVLNASLLAETDEILYHTAFNIGIAVDTPAGLFVPNIKQTDRKGLYTIAREIAELANKAQARTLTSDEMKGGTITISNIGSAHGSFFTPIINYPEVAILGVGSINKKPIVSTDDTIEIAAVLSLSLSFDHRIVDGMTAQLFMNELKRLIHDPDLLIMEG